MASGREDLSNLGRHSRDSAAGDCSRAHRKGVVNGMAVEDSQLDTVREFLKDTSRGVLMTRRRDGGIQSSPMALAADDDGNLLFSTRSTAAKVRNLKRDPYAAVCVITERFLGPWLHVEGNAEIE